MDILSKFGETLENLMFEKDLNAATLANAIDTGICNIYCYVNKEHLPMLENLVKLADYFNCTTDFLLGLEEDNSSTVFLTRPPFSEQLAHLLKHFGCSGYAFIKKAEISPSRYYDWKNGKRLPTVETVVRIADRLGCSVDFVLGRTKH